MEPGAVCGGPARPGHGRRPCGQRRGHVATSLTLGGSAPAGAVPDGDLASSVTCRSSPAAGQTAGSQCAVAPRTWPSTATACGSSSRRPSWAAPRSTRCGARWRKRSRRWAASHRSTSCSTTRGRPTRSPRPAARSSATPASRRRHRVPREPQRSSSSRKRRPPLPLLRFDGDAAREHLRPHAVPLAPLLRQLPAAVRAVQDDLARNFRSSGPRLPPRSAVRAAPARRRTGCGGAVRRSRPLPPRRPPV